MNYNIRLSYCKDENGIEFDLPKKMPFLPKVGDLIMLQTEDGLNAHHYYVENLVHFYNLHGNYTETIIRLIKAY